MLSARDSVMLALDPEPFLLVPVFKFGSPFPLPFVTPEVTTPILNWITGQVTLL